ncbi:MAG: PTS transporter subunit EIIC [Turicibacter sp.]|nr:PTS transporter subunit EIIC [Turicibacter sp.]
MTEQKSSFSEKFQDFLGPIASKISSNLYIMALRDGMMAYMPFTFIASIFLIIAHFPIQAYLDFMTGIFGDYWRARLGFVAQSTLDIGGLLVVVAIAYSMAEHFKVNKLQSTITAVVAFLILTPQAMFEGYAGRFIQLFRISAQAMFLAIIVGIFTVLIYKKASDKGFTIKLPASVPPAVSAPFESIIPSLIAITFFWMIRVGLDMFGTDMLTLVTGIIGRPLTLLGGSLAGTLVIVFVEQLLWFFGLHGGNIVGSVINPIRQIMEDENRLYSYAGYAPPNIITATFNVFGGIGIVGSVIAILIVAKSRQYKEVGKIAMGPYIFNIGEPALFGIPLMMNVIYVIPFLLSRLVAIVITYVVMTIGLVPFPTGLAQVPWTTPPVISGFLVTGSITGSILQIVLLIIITLLWIPFIKIGDKQILEQEQQFELEKAAATSEAEASA